MNLEYIAIFFMGLSIYLAGYFFAKSTNIDNQSLQKEINKKLSDDIYKLYLIVQAIENRMNL
jgi:hypothetical protein